MEKTMTFTEKQINTTYILKKNKSTYTFIKHDDDEYLTVEQSKVVIDFFDKKIEMRKNKQNYVSLREGSLCDGYRLNSETVSDNIFWFKIVPIKTTRKLRLPPSE
jgi:hypothetical protein